MKSKVRTAAFNISADDPMSTYGYREIAQSARIAKLAIERAVEIRRNEPQTLRRIAADRLTLSEHHREIL